MVPPKIYRYFSKEEDRLNFINGNIWFAGVNQNRFFRNPSDPNEYCYSQHIRILAYALSFSIQAPNSEEDFNDKYWVEIIDLNRFISSIEHDFRITKNKFSHQVSWLNKDELLKIAKNRGHVNKIQAVHSIKKDPTQFRCLIADLCSIWGRVIDYYDPNVQSATLGLESVRRASNKTKSHEFENEYRVELNTSSFLDIDRNNPAPSLHHLVEYIKLNCPSIEKVCRILDKD